MRAYFIYRWGWEQEARAIRIDHSICGGKLDVVERTMRRWFTIVSLQRASRAISHNRLLLGAPACRRRAMLHLYWVSTPRSRAIDIFTLPRHEHAPAIRPTDLQAASGRRERGYEARVLKTGPAVSSWIRYDDSSILDDCLKVHDCRFRCALRLTSLINRSYASLTLNREFAAHWARSKNTRKIKSC